MTFDYLTIIKKTQVNNDKSHTHWLCKCKCGKEIIVDGRIFINDKFKSCGCADSLVGNVFGKLTVIGLDKDNIRKHLRIWECKCDCGNTCFVREENLNKGKKHCGCVRKNMDLCNMTYGDLHVDYLVGYNKNHNAIWHCSCTCGKEINILATYLISKNKTHCGCKNTTTSYEEFNEYYIGETSNGVKFVFDKDDYLLISKYSWSSNDAGYLKAYINGKNVYLHRLIMNCDDVNWVDHINHKLYDNRKINLRIVTPSQNNMNMTNYSGHFTGVRFEFNKWRSSIWVNGKEIHLGMYLLEEDAIDARIKAEEEYFGEYSYKNSILKTNDYEQIEL